MEHKKKELTRYHLMAPIRARSVGVQLSPEESAIWKKIAALRFQASRYSCQQALHTLGLTQSWDALCERGYLTNLFQERHESLRVITYDFLSTLKVYTMGRHVSSIEFCLRNEEYSLSIDEFNNIFHFAQTKVGIIEEPDEYDWDEFWRAITLPRESERFFPARTKVNDIRNPVLRYMAKAMAYLLFARFEVGSVQTDDLFFIWCMLRGQRVNMSHYIIKYLER
ncbi:hypothetical protein AAHA92_31364 [Salvia divinorum]|uniref:Arabidopsis retrotransposon Orf1 C-terminal domain-containing protein n=1 Tax=Salvia divinorum TaxID=28513 RepID=A0ABD1FTY2_SALDI